MQYVDLPRTSRLDAHNVGADKRLAIELAIVKAKAVSGETDLRWIDARYQIADCLTKHASGKSEAVLQKICRKHSGELLQKRTCWTNANMTERFVTVLLTTKNCGQRANDQMAKMGCRQKILRSVNLDVRTMVSPTL